MKVINGVIHLQEGERLPGSKPKRKNAWNEYVRFNIYGTWSKAADQARNHGRNDKDLKPMLPK